MWGLRSGVQAGGPSLRIVGSRFQIYDVIFGAWVYKFRSLDWMNVCGVS